MNKINKKMGELVAVYDNRKTFYNKAVVITVEYNDQIKTYFLKSYKSIVAAVTQDTDIKYFYLNKKINSDLLTSQTTLRHIKEFYKQFYKNEDLTKKELLKNASIKDFDYLTIHETIEAEQGQIKKEYNQYIETDEQMEKCTSKETRKFFKNTFQGYKESQKASPYGIELLTSSRYGISNRYFYNINYIMEM